MRRRNARSEKRKELLENIRNHRDNTKSIVDTVNVQESNVYDNMTEEEYMELVRKRRTEAPFVEEDENGLGYHDDGEEQFFDIDDNQDEALYDPESENQEGKQSKFALSAGYAQRMKKKQRELLGSAKGTQKITSVFSKSKTVRPSGEHVGDSIRGKKKDMDLDGLLNDLERNPMAKAKKKSNISFSKSKYLSADFVPSKRVKYLNNPLIENDEIYPDMDNRYSVVDAYPSREDGFAPNEDVPMEVNMEMNVNGNTQQVLDDGLQVERQGVEEDKEEAVNEKAEPSFREKLLLKAKAKEKRVSKALKDTFEAKKNPVVNVACEDSNVDIPSNEVSEWWQQGQDDASNIDFSAMPEDSGESSTIQMYWYDAVEVRDRPGKLYLIGKVRNGKNGFKSCCVVVENLQRCMYAVPRQSKNMLEMSDEERNGIWKEMHHELSNVMIPSCITKMVDQNKFSTKLVKRNYAFELPDMLQGVSYYVKFKYPAKYAVPMSNVCDSGGKTFSRICGRNTRPLELFLVRNRILGPCWLEIKNVKRNTLETQSYCKVEYVCLNPKDVSPIAQSKDVYMPPPMSIMSISLKTYCNPESKHHEVVAISAIIQNNINCDSGGQEAKKSRFAHFTLIRPIDSNGFPAEFAKMASQDGRFNSSETLRIESNERSMLNFFIARVQKNDPDVIVGHNLHKYVLDVLLTRMDYHNLGGAWSRMTRLRRGRLVPFKFGEAWNEYNIEDISNGRLLVDTYTGAKELLTSQSSYALTELVRSQLNQQRVDIDVADIPTILQSNAANFVQFCRHSVDDALFVLHLLHNLEILPLTKQLTTLCGFLWSRTLVANKRAERIEYLLLHEFDRAKPKFLVPDKRMHSKQKDKSKGKKKGPQYAGGMVFAPKKGLYDDYVVLLDFNSLYPSIIREYNICFTTVDRASNNSAKEDDTETANEIPSLPSTNADEGILPNVVKRLLESRKQVKVQLKKEVEAGNGEKSKRLDIRQKAIKLTANSIYGCLGFPQSRFFAKPIAALITSTGRNTLQCAQQVAEDECGYDVVYGDTDSIMVNSKTINLEDAKRIGREIQVKCNKKFKLLELEVDYIFKTILLLNKKKYAAIVVKEKNNGVVTYEKEVKGLDMVRRDWCVLSKIMGNDILDFILSGKEREEIVELIHGYLQTRAENIRAKKEDLAQFVITKSLSKSPDQYPDKNKQYHVQVALALLAQGQPIEARSHIPYVLCVEEDPVLKRRAYHPDEVERSEGKLTIDIDWYLEAQIHPPINRLCAHIDGTSSAQLADCLGLEANKFSHRQNLGADENDEPAQIPSVLQNDNERFHDCLPVEMTCSNCNVKSAFPGVYFDSENAIRCGLDCPNCADAYWGMAAKGINQKEGDNFFAVLSNRVSLRIREMTKMYYTGWVICTDSTCKSRTQQQSLRNVRGNLCLANGCRGMVRMEYSDHDLYKQLKYFQSLFDVSRAKRKRHSKSPDTAALPFLSQRYEEIFQLLFDQLAISIRRNRYNWVEPSIWQTLFKSMQVSPTVASTT